SSCVAMRAFSWLVVAISSVICQAAPGQFVQRSSTRIIGGAEATAHAYPWQVGIWINGGSFCGGSLISDMWVLTAGHCTSSGDSFEIVMGAHRIHEEEASQVSMVSSEFIFHGGSNQGDMSLIKLPQPVSFNEYIKPVPLPTASECEQDEPFIGKSVTATGWGKFSDGSVLSDYLREVDLVTITEQVYRAKYGGAVRGDDSIYTDATGGHGICSGDSGGPLVYKNGGTTTLRGVVSIFGGSTGFCEGARYDGFAKVCKFLQWIHDNTGITIEP
ncbi:unnamed protein product, partial [Meganyctiphanes norvegica]